LEMLRSHCGVRVTDGAFEGDLIRPLGLVTLCFGYAEFEVNALLEALKEAGLPVEVRTSAPLGQKISAGHRALADIQFEGAKQIVETLEAGMPLITLRNSLVHSSILAKGRVKMNDGSKREFSVTPQKLTDLAEQIFAWKEQLSSSFQRQLLPVLGLRSR
jgi:hypothetical protein